MEPIVTEASSRRRWMTKTTKHFLRIVKRELASIERPDLADEGVSGVFPQADVQTIIQVLSDLKQRATA